MRKTGSRGGSVRKISVSTPVGPSGAFRSRAGLSARSVGPASAAHAVIGVSRRVRPSVVRHLRGAALPAPPLPRAAGSRAGDECPVSLRGGPLAISAWADRAARAGRAHRRSAAAARARAVGSRRAVLGRARGHDRGTAGAGDRRRPTPAVSSSSCFPAPDAEDPIRRALALRDRGERARARRLLEGLVEWDLPGRARSPRRACFRRRRLRGGARALRGRGAHRRALATGDFDGVLGWGGSITGRFCAACTASRSAPGARAETLCWALLWLNPGDNQGACELLGRDQRRRSLAPI